MFISDSSSQSQPAERVPSKNKQNKQTDDIDFKKGFFTLLFLLYIS